MNHTRTLWARDSRKAIAAALLAAIIVGWCAGTAHADQRDEVLELTARLQKLQAQEAALKAKMGKLRVMAADARLDERAAKAVAEQMKELQAEIAAVREQHARLVKAIAAFGEWLEPTPAEPADDAQEGPARNSTDVVTTYFGDRLSGRVIGIEAESGLRLASPGYDGHVQVLLSALDRLAMQPTEAGSGQDEVYFTNDDRIAGELAAIDDDAVIIHSDATGALTISRKVVRHITLAGARGALVDSSFETGKMDPWKVVRGAWSVADGALVCNSTGSISTVFAKLDQDEPVTFEAKVQAVHPAGIRCELILFADDAQNPYGRNSVYARFYGNRCYLRSARGGGSRSVATYSHGQSVSSGVLRFAYDPQTGKARTYLGPQLLGESTIPGGPKTGQYVLFNAHVSCKVSYLRVLRGAEAGSGGAGEQAGPDRHLLRFATGDRVTATSVALADGQLAFQTEYGLLRCPLENVERIVFPTKGQEKPRRHKDDVQVQTTVGRLTLHFERLTDECLIGSSECLGQVRILRGAIKEIRFNLYR